MIQRPLMSISVVRWGSWNPAREPTDSILPPRITTAASGRGGPPAVDEGCAQQRQAVGLGLASWQQHGRQDQETEAVANAELARPSATGPEEQGEEHVRMVRGCCKVDTCAG